MFRLFFGQCDASCRGVCLLVFDICERERVAIRSGDWDWVGRFRENGPFTSHSSASACLGVRRSFLRCTLNLERFNSLFFSPTPLSLDLRTHDHDPSHLLPAFPIPSISAAFALPSWGACWERRCHVRTLVSARCDRLRLLTWLPTTLFGRPCNVFHLARVALLVCLATGWLQEPGMSRPCLGFASVWRCGMEETETGHDLIEIEYLDGRCRCV